LLGAVDALAAAIKALKASKNPKPKEVEEDSFVQVKSVKDTIRTAMVLADALGLVDGLDKQVVAFLQNTPDVEYEEYKFKSGDVISTLEGLQQQFRDKKNSGR